MLEGRATVAREARTIRTSSTRPGGERRKVAVLGGGIAALSAAYELTDTPELRQRFDVTVYQAGFRLGGKGASGCNRRRAHRIEEHGLHVWMGFYDNAFRLMRRCYAELGRAPSEPLAAWHDAFKPHDFIAWEEEVGGGWRHWPGPFKPRPGLPGDGFEVESPWEYVQALIPRVLGVWYHMKQAPSLKRYVRGALLEAAVVSLNLASRVMAAPGDALLEPLRVLRARLFEALREPLEQDDEARRFWIGTDLVYALTVGMIADRVVTEGFDAIDGYDLRDWLRRHGASELTLRSGLIRSLYDFVFAYDGGDAARPSLGAGTMLRVTLRMLFSYRGSIFYKMQAGMGEAVFAPLYEVLRRRGVRFEFFRRVDHVGLSADGRTIDTLDLAHQATVASGDYRPLIDVDGLPCWPTEPLHEQLVEGAELEARGIDLESWWTPWKDVGREQLRRGEHFDDVVLGLPVSVLPEVCDELISARDTWRRMVEHVRTVPTQAMQLWLRPRLEGLGWSHPPPVLTAYAFPFSTWADFSHLLPREGWTGDVPRSLAYLCGPLPGHETPPPKDDHGYPERASAEAKRSSLDWLARHAGHLWPEATDAQAPRGLDLSLLCGEGEGAQRFEGQYWRANVNPSDRYVLAVPGSSRHRLRADASGFDNLWLAGDWVRTGLNLGCIESAVMAGMQAARALSGHPIEVDGESDFPARQGDGIRASVGGMT
jgi:uncharacterized protein with NAD-binding domain and iron-sulfur cluster